MSGNGVDIAAVHLSSREVADTVLRHDKRFDAVDRRFDVMDRMFEALQRDVADLRSQVSGLRQTVIEYHASVLGHGILISEPEQRLWPGNSPSICRPLHEAVASDDPDAACIDYRVRCDERERDRYRGSVSTAARSGGHGDPA